MSWSLASVVPILAIERYWSRREGTARVIPRLPLDCPRQGALTNCCRRLASGIPFRHRLAS